MFEKGQKVKIKSTTFVDEAQGINIGESGVLEDFNADFKLCIVRLENYHASLSDGHTLTMWGSQLEKID